MAFLPTLLVGRNRGSTQTLTPVVGPRHFELPLASIVPLHNRHLERSRKVAHARMTGFDFVQPGLDS
jgi:hypothetical protein